MPQETILLGMFAWHVLLIPCTLVLLGRFAFDMTKVEKTEIVHGRETAAIAIHFNHDANIAISKNGRVQCVLELERLFNIRYYGPGYMLGEGSAKNSLEDYAQIWVKALETVRDRCKCDDGHFPNHFDRGLYIPSDFGAEHDRDFIHIIRRVFNVTTWLPVDHHEAHAFFGHYSSPFHSALIFSFDGGGKDLDYNYHGFEIFLGTAQGVEHVGSLPRVPGWHYETAASWLPEVTGLSIDDVCSRIKKHQAGQGLFPIRDELNVSREHGLSLAGKMMGYASIGTRAPKLEEALDQWMELVSDPMNSRGLFPGFKPTDFMLANMIESTNFSETFSRIACDSVESQRSLAASVQSVWVEKLASIVSSTLESIGPQIEGIVLTGGCALNIMGNQGIYDRFTSAEARQRACSATSPRGQPCHRIAHELGLHVPPSPGDSGLSIGALWKHEKTPQTPNDIQYLGFQLFDDHLLENAVRDRGAQRLSSLGGVEYLAELLAGGRVWLQQRTSNASKPIIAVVRGRQEVGPRALGHRSLLAVPDSEDMKSRLNKLKYRQWWRPVAPMIADEALVEVFGKMIKSPYMTMAPQIRDEIRARFPALAHVDGTARHQSVGARDEPWIHSLLLAVGRRTGLAALINTSFNRRGKPIVNTVTESLAMLSEEPDLDYLVIEDFLFRKSP